jgi:hypothetical protein
MILVIKMIVVRSWEWLKWMYGLAFPMFSSQGASEDLAHPTRRWVARAALLGVVLLIFTEINQWERLGLRRSIHSGRFSSLWLPLFALCAYGTLWLFWWSHRVLSLELEPPPSRPRRAEIEDSRLPVPEWMDPAELAVPDEGASYSEDFLSCSLREMPAPPRREVPASIRKFTDVSFPDRVRIGKTYNLRVQLVPVGEILPGGKVRERSLPHTHDTELNLLISPPPVPGAPAPPIKVGISVAAENFEIDGPSNSVLNVPLEGKSTAAQFGLMGLEVGPGRVMLDFTQDGRPVGSVDLSPRVVVEIGVTDPSELTAPAARLLDLTLSAGATREPPDIVLKVFEHRLAGHPGRLQFVMSSTHPALADLPALDGDLGTLDLRTDVASWVGAQLQTLGALAGQVDVTAAEAEQTLAHVGCNLFRELLPPKLQDLCWTFRRRGVRSLMVLSDEPHIPWELIKPFRADPANDEIVQQDRFWGDSYALTHWLRGRPPAARFSVLRAVTIVAGSGQLQAEPDSFPTSGSNTGAVDSEKTRDMVVTESAPVPCVGLASDLPGLNPVSSRAKEPTACVLDPRSSPSPLDPLEEEQVVCRWLESYGAKIHRVPARRSSLRRTLEQGEFDILHLASHGTFGGISTADDSAILLDDGSFTAAELSPLMAASLRRNAPLIFFNTCHSARIGFCPTRLGAWGAHLVELGCGGFVGALWPVSDGGATVFASVFYELISHGRRIGEAIQLARRRVREQFPSDPTWLAYRCFADPMARVEPPPP